MRRGRGKARYLTHDLLCESGFKESLSIVRARPLRSRAARRRQRRQNNTL